MKTKITEMEQKHARVVLDLNKEITELENLVESKVRSDPCPIDPTCD